MWHHRTWSLQHPLLMRNVCDFPWLPSVLCWLGVRKSVWPVKIESWLMKYGLVISGARCRFFAYGPADATTIHDNQNNSGLNAEPWCIPTFTSKPCYYHKLVWQLFCSVNSLTKRYSHLPYKKIPWHKLMYTTAVTKKTNGQMPMVSNSLLQKQSACTSAAYVNITSTQSFSCMVCLFQWYRRSSSLAWSSIANCLFYRTFAISKINPPKL